MSVLLKLNNQMASVVDGIRPNLVQIRNGRRSGGAGVIWRQDGLIVTNAHVVAPSRKRRRTPTVILADGAEHAAKIVAFDKDRDVAALKIDVDGLEAVDLGDSENLRSGDWVTAVGHPWGVVGAATAGTVIKMGPPPELPYPYDMIQVGLHMRPGHSGGAMVDDTGRLVGINCMIAGPNVGLAVPVHTINKVLAD